MDVLYSSSIIMAPTNLLNLMITFYKELNNKANPAQYIILMSRIPLQTENYTNLHPLESWIIDFTKHLCDFLNS